MTDPQFQQLLTILGQVGSTAYQAAYRQAQTQGYIDLGWAGVLLLAALIGWIMAAHWHRRGNHSNALEADSCYGVAAIFYLIGSTGTIAGLIFLTLGSEYLLNPQWAAIQLLARLVRGG